MELALVIYLISLADQLKGVLVLGVAGVSLIGSFMLAIVASGLKQEPKEKLERYSGKLLFSTVITVPLLTIIVWVAPDKETSYTMLAAYGVQTVAEAEQARQVAGKSLQVLEKYMDQYLESTTEGEK